MTRFFNPLYAMLLVGGVTLCALFSFLYVSSLRPSSRGQDLLVYCAAGMRVPIEKIAADYEEEFGVRISLHYGGSNTLLGQIKTGHTGDLFLAADESYIEMARDEGLVAEKLVVAKIRPVIAVAKDNDSIRSVEDLAKADFRIALGDPDAAAVGKKAEKLLAKSGHWNTIEANVRKHGVFKLTVNEVANDIKLGVVDAGIIWDSTVEQYPELKAVRAPELDAGESLISIGVLNSSEQPTAALHFARYATASDRGLGTFASFGFDAVAGDAWADRPTLTFYAGSVNRLAIEGVIETFAVREGVEINTVYDGCGILTADMRSIRDGQSGAFPDVFMACDTFYLDTVQDMFQAGTEVSSADIVIVVKKGNPLNILKLEDLSREGVRVALGQPQQCTIGVLSRKLLQASLDYDAILENNVVTQTASSALLVPTISTGSADATLAYVTDTLKTAAQVDVIKIDSELALAIQPFSIANSSKQKHLSSRLFVAIANAQEDFERAGFTWKLGSSPALPSPILDPMSESPSEKGSAQDKQGEHAEINRRAVDDPASSATDNTPGSN
jgi:molybdenum ABC transporter molybdate-binding protein